MNSNPWGYDPEREDRWARDRRECLVRWLCDNPEAGKAVLARWAVSKGARYVAALRAEAREEWRRRKQEQRANG